MSQDNDGTVWIPVKQAAKLLPSCRPGKDTHLSTVIRWIRQGRLEGRRNGRWWFVRQAEVLSLLRPVEAAQARPKTGPAQTQAEERARREAMAEAILARAGI